MEINQQITPANHWLHLCHSANMKETVFSYLMETEGIDAFVTDDVKLWETMFNENGISCPVKRPDEVKQNERVVIDSASLGNDFKRLENRWKKQEKAICIYNTDKIDSSILKDLVAFHDRMHLSIHGMRLVSDKNLEKEIDNLNPEIIENLVKKELKNIVLSLLLSRSMCGTDLVKILYEKFKVFISPGVLYPTLHDLEKSGLLIYEYKLKNKIYSVRKKEQAELLLRRYARVNSLLSQFLVNENGSG